MCKHNLKFLRQSLVLYKGKPTEIYVLFCNNCGKFYIFDVKKERKISLNGELGEEI